ncbi:MAG: GGDEF domain-containing phosphodiesterase [Steroidobacteraceae bacterium]
MESIATGLQALARQFQAAYVLLHAPALAPDALVPEPAAADSDSPLALIEPVLLPLIRSNPAAQLVNRARVRRDGPLLPYRVLLCPLGGKGEGLLAVLRRPHQPPFVEADAAAIAAAAAPLLAALAPPPAASQTVLFRRPDFEAEIETRAQSLNIASVVYVNLDQLHAVNELAGFARGDEVIRAVGRLLQSGLLPAGSIASRLSGDRYAAVLFDHTLNQARGWADKARRAIEALQVEGRPARVTASLGVAVMARDTGFERALAAAETACRAAKDRGRNRVEIFETGDASMIRRQADVRDSRTIVDALENERLELHAQPIADLRDPLPARQFEVLLRLRGADGKLRSIGHYLHALERYQLFDRVDRWVVERTLATLEPQVQRLQACGARFAVNITGQSLSDAGFADFVRGEIGRRGVPGALLCLEFTETAAVRDLEATRRFIKRVAELGCRLALDDFGTGVSSLMHLKELAVHRIKIDGGFIRDVLTNARSEALVRALAQIAGHIGMETVGEFIESRQVAEFLRTLGVQYGQGYLFGRARPLGEVLDDLLGAGPAPERIASA